MRRRGGIYFTGQCGVSTSGGFCGGVAGEEGTVTIWEEIIVSRIRSN